MEFANLPPEILHHLLLVMDTRAMAHLMCCNKQFSELRTSIEYWKQIYRKEFPKISLTSTSVDKNVWYLLNRYAKQYKTIKEAIEAATSQNRTIFLAPGLYNEIIIWSNRWNEAPSERIEIIGLCDRKFTNEVLIEHKDLITRGTNGIISDHVSLPILNDNPYSYSASRNVSFANERKKFEETFKWTGTSRDPVESDVVIIEGVRESTFQLYDPMHLEVKIYTLID